MEGYIGEVRIFAGNFAPMSWQFCQGQLMSIAEYTPLFAIIGTTYGGDGQTTFALPDFRGRRAVHSGNGQAGPGLQPIDLGEIGGVENTTLLNSQMPQHTHSIAATITNTPANLMFSNEEGVAGGTPSNGYYAIATSNVYHTGGGASLAPPMVTTNTSAMHLLTTGGSNPISMVTPFLAMNYIICLEGIFPSRN